MAFQRILESDVKAVYDACAPDLRQAMLRVRELIFTTARETPGVGRLQECLKWGAPAFLTPETRSGSTIRLAPDRHRPGGFALHLISSSDLAAQFRELYPDAFKFARDRSILLNAGAAPPPELGHCIAIALTYHLAKRSRKSAWQAA